MYNHCVFLIKKKLIFILLNNIVINQKHIWLTGWELCPWRIRPALRWYNPPNPWIYMQHVIYKSFFFSNSTMGSITNLNLFKYYSHIFYTNKSSCSLHYCFHNYLILDKFLVDSHCVRKHIMSYIYIYACNQYPWLLSLYIYMPCNLSPNALDKFSRSLLIYYELT